MQEIFCEESTTLKEEKKYKKRYKLLKFLSLFFFVLAFFWVLFLFYWNLEDFQKSLITSLISFLVPLILFIVTGVILYKKKDKTHVTYDYTFVSGDLIFSKVIMNIKRAKVASFDTKQIVRVGKYESQTYNNYYLSPEVKTVVLTKNKEPMEGKGFYYVLANLTDGKKLFILECSENFIKNVVIIAGRKVLESN